MDISADQYQALIDAQKKALEAIEGYKKAHADATNKLDEQFVKIGKDVGTVAELQTKLEARIASLETVVRTRPEAILSGVGDEVAKNGAINPVAMLIAPKSKEGQRALSMVREYMEGKEREFPSEQRDMNASTDTAGGFVVPQIMLPGYIEKARARSVIWQGAGLTFYTGLQGSPVVIPIETGDSADEPQAVSETEAPTEVDSTIGEVSFTPKVFRSLTKLSNRLLRLGPLAEQIVRNRMEKTFALRMDVVVMRGTGVKESVGLANLPGINHVEIGTNGGPWTQEVVEEMSIVIEELDLADGSQKFVGHPRAFSSLKRERIAQFSGDTGGAYVVLPMSDANLRDLMGYDFLKTTKARKDLTKGSGTNLTESFFGNWAEGYAALWEDLTFRVSKETGDSTGSAFAKSQTWIVAELEYDFQVPRPGAFSYCNDISFA